MPSVFVALDKALLGVITIAQSRGLSPTQYVALKADESVETAIAAANAAAAERLPPSALESHISEAFARLRLRSTAGDAGGAACAAEMLAALYRALDAMQRGRYYR